ncbi:hypothetical protein FRC11_014566 [Ceratobasidium sp. 423]|nr:hypothetical protein FRC11_014566 [Ceratobasidium sp. 423]
MSSKGAPGQSGITAAVYTSCVGRYSREGNVMMLSPDRQLVHKPEESDPHMTCAEIKNSVLTESEKKLREVLEQLGDCKPTGMLLDFDLHAFHALDSHSRPRGEDTTVDVPMPKKRRLIGRHCPSANATEAQPTTQSNGGGMGEKKRLIDFRTGTPAFMSVRVLTVQAGKRYHHSFIDDLESFFWLVLWSAAAHLDPGRPITPHAQLLLNQLNQTDFLSLRSEKAATLFNCYMQDGKDMLDLLELVDNEWATHPIFVDVIVEFGRLAHSYYDSQTVNHSPVDVFPAVVHIFQDALASNDD